MSRVCDFELCVAKRCHIIYRDQHNVPADEILRTGYPRQGTCHNEVKSAKRMSTDRPDRYYKGVTRNINCIRCFAVKHNINGRLVFAAMN